MKMAQATQIKALEAVRKKGLVRPRELERLGIPRWALYELLGKGHIVQVSRGIYSLPDYEPTENYSYVEALKRIPNSVLCLLSALRFHNLTVQNPREVWLAVPRTAWRPRSQGVQLRIVRFSGDALTAGVKEHLVEGVAVRVTSVARTVADCFKYRNKIGIDVALEALHEGWRKKRFTMDELWRYAKLDRVTKVVMPYLETLPS
jgi:predicted transcriptional regulator of viral defense system